MRHSQQPSRFARGGTDPSTGPAALGSSPLPLISVHPKTKLLPPYKQISQGQVLIMVTPAQILNNFTEFNKFSMLVKTG